MKLLLDQGLPRSTSEILRAEGLDVVHAAEAGLSTATDTRVLEEARRDNRVVITLDSDFHMLLAQARASGPSVVRIRIEGLTAERCAALIRSVLEQCADELQQGAVVSVLPHEARVRRLPLSG
jgi:predicted nuclease of predicted toxin-antitoxin system